MRTFFALLFLFSCTIIPEDALDYLPTTGRISHMNFRDTRDYPNNTIATAGISYFGKFDQPTRIEITWGGSMKLMQLQVSSLSSSDKNENEYDFVPAGSVDRTVDLLFATGQQTEGPY